jgi:formylglycine-generating enzyme required for sulfatase activity
VAPQIAVKRSGVRKLSAHPVSPLPEVLGILLWIQRIGRLAQEDRPETSVCRRCWYSNRARRGSGLSLGLSLTGHCAARAATGLAESLTAVRACDRHILNYPRSRRYGESILTASIFISHSSADASSALKLAEDLKRAGVEVWLDEWEIGVGERITQAIQEGLHKATHLAVWLTSASVESGWVEREWQSKYGSEIASGSIVVFPLLAEDCDIPLLLKDKRYADFRGDYAKGLGDLLKVVGVKDWISPLGANFALVIPGAFLMGSDDGEENEQPSHLVQIPRPFYMGIYVVTQDEWKRIMGTEPWKGDARVREGANYPAVNVSWFDAQNYLTRLSEVDSDNTYYLPSEEEWEYATRAGTTTEFSFGDDERDMRSYGWCRDITQNFEEYAHEVGRKRPNPWGLYDMHGNVWEWTDSWYYGSYSAAPKLNPVEKMLRGGGWDYPAYGARSAFRNTLLPTRSNYVIGFRLIRRPAG